MAAAALALHLAATSTNHAATAPYIETFDDGLAQDFTFTEPATWSVQDADGAGPGDGFLRNAFTVFGPVSVFPGSSSAIASARVAFPSLAGNDFILSTNITLTALPLVPLPGDGGAVGFGLLGNPGFGFSGQYYAAEFDVLGSDAGTLRILKVDNLFGGTVQSLASGQASGISLAAGASYTLTIAGTYAVPGDASSPLTLQFSIDNGAAVSFSIAGTDSSGVFAGSSFGYRDRITAGTNSMVSIEVGYDDFAVVPEPTSAILFGAGLLGFLAFARARRTVF